MFEKRPRYYAGQADALITELFESYVRTYAPTPNGVNGLNKKVCDHLIQWLHARNVVDLGGFMKVPHQKVKEELDTIAPELEYYIDSFEDLWNFQFPVPLPISCHNPTQPPESFKLVKQEMKSMYCTESEAKLGATLKANGTLMDYKLTRDLFPEVSTANPLVETITNHETRYVNDMIYMWTFEKTGKLNVDKTWRDHVGAQARDLFPNLPDVGKVGDPRFIAGSRRYFTDMLYHRFTNARKAMSRSDGYTYKKHLSVNRNKLCEAALTLTDRVGSEHMPIAVEDTGEDDHDGRLLLPDTRDDTQEMRAAAAALPNMAAPTQRLTLGAAAAQAAIAHTTPALLGQDSVAQGNLLQEARDEVGMQRTPKSYQQMAAQWLLPKQHVVLRRQHSRLCL